MRTRAPRAATAVAAAFLITLSTAAAASAHDTRGPHGPGHVPQATTIATGLDSPRGLTVARDGTVYVAEAGTGGSGPCFANPEGGDDVCYGTSGAVVRVRGGHVSPVVSGLPSLATPDGASAIGPSDVALDDGRLVFTVGLGGSPDLAAQLPAPGSTTVSSLLRTGRHGFTRVADLAAYEASANPDGVTPPDTNVTSVATTRGGYVTVDAGGNSLLRVDRRGTVSTLAVFPQTMVDAPPFLGLPEGTQIPMQAVPTSVVRGPDGAYYVGQLTGFPFPQGAASVYRVVPGQEPQVYASGFTNIIDLGFGPDGRLYVLEISKNGLLDPDHTGALLRVARDGSTTAVETPVLTAPGGLAFDRQAAYISNNSVTAGAGEVLRVPLG